MEDSLRRNRAQIVREWTDQTLSLFPEEAMGFLRNTADPFANPVGTTIAGELEFLFGALLEGLSPEEVRPRLDPIVQITCVQKLDPSTAVSFVFTLKEIVHAELMGEFEQPRADVPGVWARLLEFDRRIDRLALMAFDCYAGYRERLAGIRVHEVRSQVATLLRMADGGHADEEACASTEGGCSL